jgi:hypothetical protein
MTGTLYGYEERTEFTNRGGIDGVALYHLAGRIKLVQTIIAAASNTFCGELMKRCGSHEFVVGLLANCIEISSERVDNREMTM